MGTPGVMETPAHVRLHVGDLPDGFDPGDSVAIDTETMGLRQGRDRLCLVQVSRGDGTADLVRIARVPAPAPNLVRLIEDPSVVKLFHFARFDVAVLDRTFGVLARPVYCTMIASRFARTFGARHSLRDLCSDLLSLKISKQEQCTDWGAAELTPAQIEYAAADVLHLHRIRVALDAMLEREGRGEWAARCFEFLPWRARIDVAGWDRIDLFAHSSAADE